MNLSFRRIWAITRKEFLHIIHDSRTLALVFLMPILQLILYGYALNLEIQRVDMAVVDYSRSTASRHLIETFSGSKFFRLFELNENPSQVGTLFKERKAKVAMVIPPDFARKIRKQLTTPVQFLIDASDANAATLIRNYCNRVILTYNVNSGNKIQLPFNMGSTVFFNPNFTSAYFFVPGLIAMILIMISALLTSVTIAREKETGTLEQILVSPIKPAEIMIGKVFPYIFLAFLDASMILAFGAFGFKIPFVGSLTLLLILSILYIILSLSLGLLISTIASSQQVAMMIAQTATVLPTIMLSGLIFPIASMPKWLQYLTYIIPARFYLLIVRGIVLKGSLLVELLTPIAILVVMTVLFLIAAVWKFQINLEK